MSVLGIVVRTLPAQRAELAARLAALPGCELGPDPGDGRLVAVLESLPGQPAALSMEDIAQWPQVQSLSLVYEHSDPAEDTGDTPHLDFRHWRSSVRELMRQAAADGSAVSLSPSEPDRPAQGAGEP
ncbi:MAG: chaperone NapD [Pseudomonadota bacterium]|nr:chaperone NapD [Pseudomonadota bacterium]